MKWISKLAILLLFSFLFLDTSVFGQRPSRVVSIVLENHDFSYYQSMAKQWKLILDQNPADADAWFNYYAANRYAKMFHGEFSRSKDPVFMDRKLILEKAATAIPGTYEYLFIKTSEQVPAELVKDKSVLKAYALGPDRQEIFPMVMNYYELLGQKPGKEEIARKWFSSNTMSSLLLNYNYNVLMSVDDDAVIFTNGDNDTYPLWVLQETKGVKPNVMVLNLFLIQSLKEYQDRVFKELNIPGFNLQEQLQLTGNNPGNSDSGLIRHILDHCSRPVYFANTFDRESYEALEIDKDLYLTGLALKYDKTGMDNLAFMRNAYENTLLMDYIVMSFSKDASANLVDYMNLSYIPMLMKLCEHYRLSGEESKAAGAARLGMQIAKSIGREEEYRAIFTCGQ